MVETESKRKEYDYDKIHISLENCILPLEKIDETPSMKDGLDRDTENELRMYACEMIQTAGILLKVPQVNRYYLEDIRVEKTFFWLIV